MRSVLCLLVLSIVTLAGAQSRCKQFSFTGDIKAGASFNRALGSDLSFRVEPEEANGIHGWNFEIGSSTAVPNVQNNYIFLVTPPYHFRHPTDLTTDYRTPAQLAVKKGQVIHFWFVLSRKDAKIASAAAGA